MARIAERWHHDDEGASKQDANELLAKQIGGDDTELGKLGVKVCQIAFQCRQAITVDCDKYLSQLCSLLPGISERTIVARLLVNDDESTWYHQLTKTS